MINVYNYIDPSVFLKDHLEELKTKNSAFSLRAWAKQLGMKSHAPLHDILNGKRKVPKKLIPPLLKSLKLDAKATKYFETLVDLQRSKSEDEKELYLERLKKLSPAEMRSVNDLETYKVVSDPIHLILSELSQLKSFDPNPTWMKQNFRVNYNMRDLENMYARLHSVGLLFDKNGKVHRSTRHLYTTLETTSESVQKYHTVCSQLGQDLISKLPLEKKEFNSVALNLKNKDIPKIKERLREFMNDLIDEFEAPAHKGDETYQLNLHLFSLSKSDS
jgi:uncharacterized protein (TIGR02147 family)